ncbi:MAG: hypothetical protein A3G32_10085 [Deltaproteobacteria bacterium RIFCSPLOWO2_12_FULL_40_28]|nr:MAG: hypothetical protein A3C45_05095 [Deltaproteobacteria bacterium RIFCSPHIGHO2_02_FULL_40_28]OGQ20378.1 MAG: hypothetical protein A3E27_00475 [Deltaproteobacteria bacterium RIFCSPHIGHO2_12_FULL_40_32]OGQ41347.1 MAG: hypothetical protein A3I69_02125 [Deltaproteobacteria bacterium RIFCSPLOWO2_02_FULL_40_36]OGQ54986.1 MAG: hypothetical protein A3G32_10085 [Deltaproteobacteria bacterium RIFCSPLOWO2_12_FULL_40_28]
MKTNIGKIVIIFSFVVLGFVPATWSATKFALDGGATTMGPPSADHATPIGIFTEPDASGVNQVFMSTDNGSGDITVKQVTTGSETKSRPLFVPESDGTTVVVLNADVAETKTCDGPVIVYLVDVLGTGQLRGTCIPSDWATLSDVATSDNYHVFNITETLLKDKNLNYYDITSPVTVTASLDYAFAAASGTLEFSRDYHQIAYTQTDGSLNYLLVDFKNVQVDYTHIDEVADYFWMINNPPSGLSIGTYGASAWDGFLKSGFTSLSKPRFSVKGDRIYFLRDVNGTNQLGVVPVRGMSPAQITEIEGSIADITPLLPNEYVAFTLNTGGLNELGVIYVSIEQSTVVTFCSAITAFSDPAFASQHPALVYVPASDDDKKDVKDSKTLPKAIKLLQNLNINNHPYDASRMLVQAASFKDKATAAGAATAVTPPSAAGAGVVIDRITKGGKGALKDALAAAADSSEDGVGIMYDRVDTAGTNLYYTWLTEDQLACASMAAQTVAGTSSPVTTVTNLTLDHYVQTCDQVNEHPHSYYPSNKDASFADRTDSVTTPPDVIYRRIEGSTSYPTHLHDITTTAPDCSTSSASDPAAPSAEEVPAEEAPSEEAAAAVAASCADAGWSSKQISYDTYRGLVQTGSTPVAVTFLDGTTAYASLIDGEIYYDATPDALTKTAAAVTAGNLASTEGVACASNKADDGAYGSGCASLNPGQRSPDGSLVLAVLLVLGSVPQITRRLVKHRSK